MIGPQPIAAGPERAPVLEPWPRAEGGREAAGAAGPDRPPVELPLDRVELSPELVRELAARRSGEDSPRLDGEADERETPEEEAIREGVDLSGAGVEPKNHGVTFRVFDEIANLIQARIVDRETHEVVRAVPQDEVVDFRTRFRQAVGTRLDVSV